MNNQTEPQVLPTNMSLNLKDYIQIYENFLDKDFCKKLVTKIKKENWHKHSYYDYKNNIKTTYENDLSVAYADLEEKKFIEQRLDAVLRFYLTNLKMSWFTAVHGFTPIRFNRYDKGTEMRIHCDHIHTMFDGEKKGIPTLTLLGALNDDYKGGELTIFDSWILPFKAGSIVVFPSNFLYPHEVLPVTKGTRYSYVSWAW